MLVRAEQQRPDRVGVVAKQGRKQVIAALGAKIVLILNCLPVDPVVILLRSQVTGPGKPVLNVRFLPTFFTPANCSEL